MFPDARRAACTRLAPPWQKGKAQTGSASAAGTEAGRTVKHIPRYNFPVFGIK